MANRDFYTADGRDWFEPGPEALEETKVEDGATWRRTRTWQHTGGISGVFSKWGAWEKVEAPAVLPSEIPF